MEHLKGGYCLTLLSEATRKLLGKRSECCKSVPPQNGTKASRQGAAKHLKGGYCLTLLSEASEKLLGKRQNAAKASRQGGAEHLKGGYGYCLTLFSEATRKLLGKHPEWYQSLPPGRCGAFEGRLLPNDAF